MEDVHNRDYVDYHFPYILIASAPRDFPFFTESGKESEKLFSNLESVMARKEAGLSRSLTFEPGELFLLDVVSWIFLQKITSNFCSNFEHL